MPQLFQEHCFKKQTLISFLKTQFDTISILRQKPYILLIITNRKEKPMEETSIAKLEAQKNELKTKPKTKSNISKINHIKSTINRIYREDKAQILEFEQNNYRYLALIRSTNGYYKLTHHSALFYSRDLAPKLNLSANLQPDGDFQSVSSIGIVSIADIDAFSKNLRKLKATRVKTKNNTGNIIIFKQIKSNLNRCNLILFQLINIADSI